jgi:hypothetical protein
MTYRMRPTPGKWRTGLPMAVAACVLLCGLGVQAATIRLDDSASQAIPPNARWHWGDANLRTGLNTMYMDFQVKVRIDTQKHAGKIGRVYMVFPQDSTAPINAQWESQGVLLPGRMTSGDRVLVYSGVIPGPRLEDQLQVRLSTDSRWMTQEARRIAFHFELDTN